MEFFYSKFDSNNEPISKTNFGSRLLAAKFFAKMKNLTLKSFLSIYRVKKMDNK